MTDRAATALAFQALTVGLKAQLGPVPRGDLLALRRMADDLPDGAPLRDQALRFAADHAGLARAGLLRGAGQGLVRDLQRVLRPAPVDMGRVDIHG